MELNAIAFGRISFGTRLGASAPSAGPVNARATPISAEAKKRIGRLIASRSVNQASPTATST
jgi:hypothetical protein